MSDEKPVVLSKKDAIKAKSVSAGEKDCIVHCCVTKDPVKPLSFIAFTSIHNAKKIRQEQSIGSNRFDQVCANIPPTHDPDNQGMHRKCFKSFINVAALRKRKAEENLDVDDLTGLARSSTRISVSGASILFPQECVFCDKSVKKKKSRETEYLTKCVTQCAENSIKEVAKVKQDFKLLGKIDGVDLRAREAMYHETCRRDYVRRDDRIHHVVEEKNAWLGVERTERGI